MKRGFQVVWWARRWWKLWPKFIGPYPGGGPNRGCIYAWRFAFGPIEIRRWAG